MGDWIQTHALAVCSTARAALAAYAHLEARALEGVRFGFHAPRLLGVTTTRKWGVELSILHELEERFDVSLVHGSGRVDEVVGDLEILDPDLAFAWSGDEAVREAIAAVCPARRFGEVLVYELDIRLSGDLLAKRRAKLPRRIRSAIRKYDAGAVVGLRSREHGLVVIGVCAGTDLEFETLATPMFAARAGHGAWPITSHLDMTTTLPLTPWALDERPRLDRHGPAAIWEAPVWRRQTVRDALAATDDDERCAGLAMARRWAYTDLVDPQWAAAEDRHVAELAQAALQAAVPGKPRRAEAGAAATEDLATVRSLFDAPELAAPQPRSSPNPVERAFSRLLRVEPPPAEFARELALGHPSASVQALGWITLADWGDATDVERAASQLQDPGARWLVAKLASPTRARELLWPRLEHDPLAPLLTAIFDGADLTDAVRTCAHALSGGTYWAFTCGAPGPDRPAPLIDDGSSLLANAPSYGRLGDASQHGARLRWDGDPASQARRIELWCEAALRCQAPLPCAVAFANALWFAEDNRSWRTPPAGWIVASLLHPDAFSHESVELTDEIAREYATLGELGFSEPDAPSRHASEIISRARFLLDLLGPGLPQWPLSEPGSERIAMLAWTSNALAWELTVSGAPADALEHATRTLTLNARPEYVDTKVRALLGAGAREDAAGLARWLRARYPASGVLDDLDVG